MNRVLDRINNSEFLKQKIIEPLIEDIYQKTHNYFITIISLYGITILLLIIILLILLSKKK